MNEENFSRKYLAGLRLSAASKVMGFTEEQVVSEIIKETGRLMFNVQEAIELIIAQKPDSGLAEVNVYMLQREHGTLSYFRMLESLTNKIYSEAQEAEFDYELRDKILSHMKAYVESVTRLDGILAGIALDEMASDVTPPRRKFDY